MCGPRSVGEACGLLAADDGARVIAGGQTLIPMLAMRLARPTRLVDIARIADLAFIRDDADGVAIGAVTRQAVAERRPDRCGQAAAAGQGAAVGRPCPDAPPRHHRRLDRQRRPGGRDPARRSDAAGDHRGAGRIGHHRDPRRRILSGPDDHGGAGGGHRHPRPFPRLDARPDRRRLSRGQRAPQRLRLRRQRRAGCARRRRPLHRAQRRHRRRRRHAGAPRCGIRRAGGIAPRGGGGARRRRRCHRGPRDGG